MGVLQYQRQKWADTFGSKLSWFRQKYRAAAHHSKHCPGLCTSDSEQHWLAYKKAYRISARLAAGSVSPYGPDLPSVSPPTDPESAATDQICKFTKDLTGVEGIRVLSYSSPSHGLQI